MEYSKLERLEIKNIVIVSYKEVSYIDKNRSVRFLKLWWWLVRYWNLKYKSIIKYV